MGRKIRAYQNLTTGDLFPAHYLGIDEQGRELYARPDDHVNWNPVDDRKMTVVVDTTEDGNWVVFEN